MSDTPTLKEHTSERRETVPLTFDIYQEPYEYSDGEIIHVGTSGLTFSAEALSPEIFSDYQPDDEVEPSDSGKDAAYVQRYCAAMYACCVWWKDHGQALVDQYDLNGMIAGETHQRMDAFRAKLFGDYYQSEPDAHGFLLWKLSLDKLIADTRLQRRLKKHYDHLIGKQEDVLVEAA